jgi:hypothetical protein
MRFLFSSKKFKDPLSTVVYTTIYVMKEKSPIIFVSHELDGAWQFMGSEPIEDYTKIAMLVSLEQVIKLDKSVLKVADLPPGYCATRKSRSDKWVVAKIEYSEEEMKEFGFYCSKCGIYHNEIPMAYGTEAPYQYFFVPENEREKRCILNDDQCIIDERLFFIRGQIELAVEDNPDNFCWNVWVSIDEEDFNRMSESWEDENRILEPPYMGKLSTQLEPYPSSLDIPVAIITQKPGYVPKIEVLECNHPLYWEQENGITMDRITAFAKEILYSH